MGKKSKKSKSANGELENGIPRHVRRDILEMCNSLLEKCSVPFGSQNNEWTDFMDVYKIVEKLRKKQTSYVLPRSKADAHAVEFIEWLLVNGVNLDSVTVERYGDMGHGLKAAKDLDAQELFLSIPVKLMMTGQTAKASIIGPLIQSDRMLQSMPNVVMALHLLCEFAQPDSFWQPYLNMLPETYTTCLYFTPDDLQCLKGSPVLGDFLNQFRSVTRQYAYFFKLFQGHPDTGKLPIKNICYDDYRWAVSTVMTRQNDIPVCSPSEVLKLSVDKNGVTTNENENSSNIRNVTAEQQDVSAEKLNNTETTDKDMNNGEIAKDASLQENLDKQMAENVDKTHKREAMQTALIPLWDMCNHQNGHLTTGFDPETQCCECYALKSYRRGQQVLIFYGPRSNAEFLLHCGFVYEDNVHDKMAVKLGLSKNDPLYSLKAEVLSRILPSAPHTFYLHADTNCPVDSDTLAYLRVFALDKDSLYHLLVGEKSAERRESLLHLNRPVSRESEMKAWRFLEARCQLLLKSYPNSIEMDDELLSKGSLSACARLACQLLRGEKRILRNVAFFACEQMQRVAERCGGTGSECSDTAAQDATILQQGRDDFDRTMKSCLNTLREEVDNAAEDGHLKVNASYCSEERFVRQTGHEALVSLGAADILKSFHKELEQVSVLASSGSNEADERVVKEGRVAMETAALRAEVTTELTREVTVLDDAVTNYGNF